MSAFRFTHTSRTHAQHVTYTLHRPAAAPREDRSTREAERARQLAGEPEVALRAGRSFGTITLSWPQPTRGEVRADQLLVTYGDPEDPYRAAYRAGALPQAPVINRIPLVGQTAIDIDQAIAHLATHPHTDGSDVEEQAWWLRAWRLTPTGHREPAPDRTRARTGHIVARLVEDFLHRDDADQIWNAHLHATATYHAHLAETDIARIHAEIAAWQAQLDHATQLHHHALNTLATLNNHHDQKDHQDDGHQDDDDLNNDDLNDDDHDHDDVARAGRITPHPRTQRPAQRPNRALTDSGSHYLTAIRHTT